MKSNYLFIVPAAMFLLTGATCNGEPPIGNTIQNQFVRYLTKEEKYTVKPMPSTLERGGSLVYVDEIDGEKKIQWVGDLLSCGIPADVIYGKDEPDALGRVEREALLNARFPKFEADTENTFNADFTAAIPGFPVSASSTSDVTVVMNIGSAGYETIKVLAVAAYLSDPITQRSLEPHCVKALTEKDNVAYLTNVAFIEQASVSFRRIASNGASAELTKPELLSKFKLDASIASKIDENGTMQIGERMYVAFKEAKYVPESGATLSGGSDVLRDATTDLAEASN
ncbi:MAG: hypothetical protein AAFR11_09370 [Pseudomonadota bacterium]